MTCSLTSTTLIAEREGGGMRNPAHLRARACCRCSCPRRNVHVPVYRCALRVSPCTISPSPSPMVLLLVWCGVSDIPVCTHWQGLPMCFCCLRCCPCFVVLLALCAQHVLNRLCARPSMLLPALLHWHVVLFDLCALSLLSRLCARMGKDFPFAVAACVAALVRGCAHSVR